MISLGLRSGVQVEEIIKQLKGIRSSEVGFNQGEMIYSLPDGVAKTLEKHINRQQQSLQLSFKETPTPELIVEEAKIKVSEPIAASTEKPVSKMSVADFGHVPVCPTCTSMLRMAEGCMKCESCGYSKCG
jgi:ribonucleoside-diphosphate reductase alpha chain